MLEDILAGWRRGIRGPLPQLTGIQVLTAIVLLRDHGPLGRRALSRALRIKDGVARGLLERLAEQNMIRIRESGALLSEVGLKRLEEELARLGVQGMRELDVTSLIPRKLAVAIHVPHRYEQGMTGVRERDEAVRAGAEGAITITMLNGKLVVPPDNRKMPSEEDIRFKQLFALSDKDLLVIGFAETLGPALIGSLAAVASLSRK
ncbi:MAG TPA: DUF4443 domain-containing protein [Candidatus Binatus sp.]|nr:DUF4443 domain-containing protein [Candidatus Binatus sp.]